MNIFRSNTQTQSPFFSSTFGSPTSPSGQFTKCLHNTATVKRVRRAMYVECTFQYCSCYWWVPFGSHCLLLYTCTAQALIIIIAGAQPCSHRLPGWRAWWGVPGVTASKQTNLKRAAEIINWTSQTALICSGRFWITFVKEVWLCLLLCAERPINPTDPNYV